jgi:hypothetical protein
VVGGDQGVSQLAYGSEKNRGELGYGTSRTGKLFPAEREGPKGRAVPWFGAGGGGCGWLGLGGAGDWGSARPRCGRVRAVAVWAGICGYTAESRASRTGAIAATVSEVWGQR